MRGCTITANEWHRLIDAVQLHADCLLERFGCHRCLGRARMQDKMSVGLNLKHVTLQVGGHAH